MIEGSPRISASTFLYNKLDGITAADKEGKRSALKELARFTGNVFLLVFSAVEITGRYGLAIGALAISFAYKGEEEELFADKYVHPLFRHAKVTKKTASTILSEVTSDYTAKIKPFLETPVEIIN